MRIYSKWGSLSKGIMSYILQQPQHWIEVAERHVLKVPFSERTSETSYKNFCIVKWMKCHIHKHIQRAFFYMKLKLSLTSTKFFTLSQGNVLCLKYNPSRCKWKNPVVNGLANWAIVVIAIAPRPQFERQVLLHQRHS